MLAKPRWLGGLGLAAALLVVCGCQQEQEPAESSSVEPAATVPDQPAVEAEASPEETPAVETAATDEGAKPTAKQGGVGGRTVAGQLHRQRRVPLGTSAVDVYAMFGDTFPDKLCGDFAGNRLLGSSHIDLCHALPHVFATVATARVACLNRFSLQVPRSLLA